MKDCGGELLWRVRNGLASDQERVAFEAHVESCESCRMTLDVTYDFDAIGEAEAGDWDRVVRMADRAAAVHGTRKRAPFRMARGPWPFMVAALVFAGTAIASGAFWLASRSNVETESSLRKDTSSQQGPEDKLQSPKLVDLPADAGPEEIDDKEPVVAPSDMAEMPSRPHATAADVYRAANDARRSGQVQQAIRAYERLQRDYPSTAEAHASRVSLGGLFLKNGASSGALTQFDAYLAAGGGRLTAEALYGRAQALRALGRPDDEVQNLKRLIKNYPHSTYATHAKLRLSQLR